MEIHVRLFATLRNYVPASKGGATLTLNLPGDATLADLLQSLNLPLEEVKLCYVNGRYQETNYQLNEGDEVGIFPPIGGG
jgi:molybdopterin converting factor small subunit